MGLVNAVTRLLGVYNKVGMARTMKLMVRDKVAFALSVKRIQQWNVEKIILAHDQIIDKDARVNLDRAFAWLSP